MNIIDLDEVLSGVELQERKVSLRGPNHGSSTGELRNIVEYYNPLFYEWTADKDSALEGHVFCIVRDRMRRI
jgi:hypothetical protein